MDIFSPRPDAPYASASAIPGGATRTLLPNTTTLPGDNVLIVASRSGFSGLGGPVQTALRAIDPLGEPFSFVVPSHFEPMGGPAGPVRAVVRRPDDGVTCALAVRDDGGSVAVLRNCVTGDLTTALAPLRGRDPSIL